MSTDRDPNAIRLPDDVAQRLLARATELDERHGRTSIDQLRRAATEAGISPAAFEGALAELARGELGRPEGRGTVAAGGWPTHPLRRRLLVVAAAVFAVLIGLGLVRLSARNDAAAVRAADGAERIEVPPAAPRAP